jgi:hypothetical protein
LVLSGGYERPAFTPMLFQQLDIAHDHATVGGLAHVVDGEQADLYGVTAPCQPYKGNGS